MHADVAIIGGGPAGAAAAIRAARLGLSTVVLESSPVHGFHIGETVPPDIQALLSKLDIWPAFLADRHCAAGGTCSAWGEADLAWQDALISVHGSGWRLDRLKFDAMLLAQADAAGAQVLRGFRVAHVDRMKESWQVTGDSQTVSANFLVEASGRPAAFARCLGAKRVQIDRLLAVFAVLASHSARMLHTLIESAECGWWYAAQLPDGKAVISLFTDADILRRTRATRPEVWCRLLADTKHVSALFGEPSLPPRIMVASAASHCLDHLCGDSWIAVGDAATAWDPLASAGICLALRSGIEAAERIAQGTADALRDYQHTMQLRFKRFLFERRSCYSLESRWPTSEFWERRSGVHLRGRSSFSALPTAATSFSSLRP